MKRELLLIAATAFYAQAQNSYAVRNLASDLPGIAEQQDENLKNPWGISASSTSPLWISNNHTGNTTVYNSDGKAFPDGKPLVVVIPPPSSKQEATSSAPTGQVFNDVGGFEVESGKAAMFLFCTEDGTIAAWNGSVDQSNARIMIDNSAKGAVYKGIAVAMTADGPRLYAADFHNGTIDVFDAHFNPVAVSDEMRGPVIPGFAPFNVQRLGQKLFVTYARQSDAGEDDVPGAGNGFVYVFSPDGRLLSRLIEKGALNSPWGLAIAPEYFGSFGQALLVANFGDGTIHAYDSCSGEWLGSLADANGKQIVIPGIWGLRAGNGHNGGEAGLVYFTAGIPGDGDIESHGLFGSIKAVAPAPPPSTPAPTPAPSTYDVSIKSLQFNPTPVEITAGSTIVWTNADGFAHTVKGDTTSFGSDILEKDGTFKQTFDTPGNYKYHCTIHPFMKGEVVVK